MLGGSFERDFLKKLKKACESQRSMPGIKKTRLTRGKSSL
jgi:hypothetical protein